MKKDHPNPLIGWYAGVLLCLRKMAVSMYIMSVH